MSNFEFYDKCSGCFLPCEESRCFWCKNYKIKRWGMKGWGIDEKGQIVRSFKQQREELSKGL